MCIQVELLRKQLDVRSKGEVPVGEQNLGVVGLSVLLKVPGLNKSLQGDYVVVKSKSA